MGGKWEEVGSRRDAERGGARGGGQGGETLLIAGRMLSQGREFLGEPVISPFSPGARVLILPPQKGSPGGGGRG